MSILSLPLYIMATPRCALQRDYKQVLSEGGQSTLCLRRLRVVKLLSVLAQFHAGKMMDTTDYFKMEFNNTIINNKLLP